MERLNNSLAYRLDQVAPGLDAERDEGDFRMQLLRETLKQTAGKLSSDFLDPESDASLGACLAVKRGKEAGRVVLDAVLNASAQHKPRVCLVYSTNKLLSVSEADKLTESERMTCVAIQNSDKVAMPSDGSGEPPHVIMTIPETVVGGKRPAKLDIYRVGLDSIHLLSYSAGGVKKMFKVSGLPVVLLERLFAIGNSLLPSSTGVPRRKRDAPDYIKSAIADFLERRMRLQVLCTASNSAPVSRTVVLERAYLCATNTERNKWLSIDATLHKSSSSCICESHGLRFECTGCVKIRLETCGRPLQTVDGRMRCPCHETALDATGRSRFNEEGMCTEGTTLTVSCSHDSGKVRKRGVYIDSMKLTDADRKELSTILVSMAKFLVETKDMFGSVWVNNRDGVANVNDKLSVELSKSLAEIKATQLREQDAKVYNPRELLRRDMVAVDLLRGGNVFRHTKHPGQLRVQPDPKRARKSDKTLQLMTKDASSIAGTHAHLFRKTP